MARVELKRTQKRMRELQPRHSDGAGKKPQIPYSEKALIDLEARKVMKNPSTMEAKAEGPQYKSSLDNIVRPCLKKKEGKRKNSDFWASG
jgi:hypothetical protein